MAKAKKKRSAARAKVKRRPRKAPPGQPPEPEWHKEWRKAFEPLSARAEQFRLPQEAVERFRRQFQQPTDTTRIDRAIAHRAGITSAAPAPAAEPSPPTTPEKTELRATIIVRAAAIAVQMKAAGEISEGVRKQPFAEELARRIEKPESGNYIRNNMEKWGLWPIAAIKLPKDRT